MKNLVTGFDNDHQLIDGRGNVYPHAHNEQRIAKITTVKDLNGNIVPMKDLY